MSMLDFDGMSEVESLREENESLKAKIEELHATVTALDQRVTALDSEHIRGQEFMSKLTEIMKANLESQQHVLQALKSSLDSFDYAHPYGSAYSVTIHRH